MATLRILIFITLGLSLDSSQVKAIDGGYSNWTECSECSVTCGGGRKTFTRTCTNPPPSDGGKNCSELGKTYKIVSCNDQDCSVDGGYTDWSTSECSVTCGGGTQTLTRTCTNPPPSNGGKDCSGLGPATETVSCIQPNCPVDGGYSDWMESTNCSVTCGGGTKILTRTCTNPPPSYGGKDCSEQGLAYKTVSCNNQDCPVDGGYTKWSISKCSVTCGGGTQTLTRTCTDPPPSNGGKNCSDLGPAKTTVPCIQPKCPIDGNYSDWVECTNCSVTCGGGIKVLTRSCNNPPPSYGGKNCSGLGRAVWEAPCNKFDCPPPCKPALDIVLILDKSSSIKKKHLEKAVTFLGALVAKFNPSPDADHFGFITFSKNAHVVFNFTDSQYHDKDALLEKIASEPIITKRGTGTHLALDEAGKLFTVAEGDRPDVPNLLILLTDGKPDNVKKTVEAARVLEEKDVYIVAVGIGKGIDEDTLQEIVGVSNPVVLVEDFNQLEKMIDTIKSKACSD